MSQTTVPPRSEIPSEHTWDTASVFPSVAAWEAEFQAVGNELADAERFRNHLAEGPTTVADFFEKAEQLKLRAARVFLYGRMVHNVDTADQVAAAKNDRAQGLYARVMGALAFADPELMEIGFETLRRWMHEEPRLTIYEHYFDSLERQREHVRSAEVEQLLSQLMDPFRSATATHGVLADADLTFNPAHGADGEYPIEIAQGNIAALLSQPDREVRRTAWENYADAHLAFKNTTANCIAAGVKQHVFLARARRYESAIEAALAPHHVPVGVFHSLIEAFHQNLPTWHRYWRLRRRALGYEKLYVYDTRAPLTGKMPSVPFDRAVEWIVEGMAPLGDEYVDVMRNGVLEQRWVDVYPNQGKRAGAFSTGAPGTNPFILMSYNDDVFSLSTLAHELGHSMHSYYSWRNQPLVYARYPTFLAEVASNFNQAIVRAHLLDAQSDRDFKIAVIEEAMGNFHRYFFIMPTLARFELEIHQRVERGEGLNADGLIELMHSLFSEGYGDEVEVDHDRAGITWAEFPTHMYLNFYVFQYATGISAAHALAERVLGGEPNATEDYLAFIKSGGSLYPLDALKLAGVDMSTPEPVEKTFGVLARLVDQLEELVG
jgi:oligoendopeptidase F